MTIEKIEIDGIPLWQYLKNEHDSAKKNLELTNKDFGKFAEIIGKRITWNYGKTGILNDVFPNITIISANRRHLGVGDIGYIVSYKNNDGDFKQKVVIFEIKHGRLLIGKYQFGKYCRIVTEPENYFPKAEEVKVVFMMFEDINTIEKTAIYRLRELDKELARKFLTGLESGDEKNDKI